MVLAAWNLISMVAEYTLLFIIYRDYPQLKVTLFFFESRDFYYLRDIGIEFLWERDFKDFLRIPLFWI